jgi:hypothetical protein
MPDSVNGAIAGDKPRRLAALFETMDFRRPQGKTQLRAAEPGDWTDAAQSGAHARSRYSGY